MTGIEEAPSKKVGRAKDLFFFLKERNLSKKASIRIRECHLSENDRLVLTIRL